MNKYSTKGHSYHEVYRKNQQMDIWITENNIRRDRRRARVNLVVAVLCLTMAAILASIIIRGL